MGRFIDLTGRKFGMLSVIGRSNCQGKKVKWLCKCACGNNAVVQGCHLKSGNTVSCGCLHSYNLKERNTTHGMAKSREYKIWAGMVKRCKNPNSDIYHHYGGRGIRVCERWLKFENFYADMGDIPKGMSLERINNEGNYSPENCRWATIEDQNRNKRNNVVIEFQGKSQCLTDWAKEIGITRSSLKCRLSELNWPIEKALTTPKTLN